MFIFSLFLSLLYEKYITFLTITFLYATGGEYVLHQHFPTSSFEFSVGFKTVEFWETVIISGV